VLLNNDTIVPERWLNQLIGLAQSFPDVGLVGPMSNYAAPPQLVEVVPYRMNEWGGASGEWREKCKRPDPSLATHHSPLATFAREWREQHDKKWLYAERLGGFCLLVKRAVLNKIGSELNDSSDLGLFDTDILSAKAREAGFMLAVCRDLFIHHFGTRTFAHGGSAAAR
jgi:GT2 family glycosyltransferase